jgi:hypothetical protein
VLDAPHRERLTIRLPATVLPHRELSGASSRRRWTAALLAGLGFSPFSLAAAAVFHLAFLLAIGPWILTQAKAVRSIQIQQPSAGGVARLIYMLPTRASPTRVTPRNQAVQTTALDSASSRTTPPAQGSALGREVNGALSQELRYVRDGFELEPEDRPKLELIVRILSRWPELRIRVLGAAPRPRERGPLPGMAEAEAMKRTLVQAGIAPERIDIDQMPESERRCPERELNCAAARRRVRTLAAGPAGEGGAKPPLD